MDTMPVIFSSEERLNRLRLIRSQNVGPATFFALMDRFTSAAEALAAAPELSRRGGRKRAIRLADRAAVEAEIEALHQLGGRLITLGESDYPSPLAVIADPPPLIQVMGDVSLLGRDCIGIVGARNASAAGRRFTRDIAADLGACDLVVASGMARGIDTAAHQGALKTGTIAVVAGGVDVTYPRENQPLYEDLLDHGAVIAEQPLGTQPIARHFPPRNRLISGLSLGVLVIEAAPRSGSLITARMALEQGREVFAVPGSPLDPRYRGTNGLIRDGAVLTESVDDVIENLEAMKSSAGRKGSPGEKLRQPVDIRNEIEVSRAQTLILELLGPVPVSVDELLRECQLSHALMVMVLLELELAGRLERHPGNRVSLVS
ncbi:MAG: DNA-processing protein DprA [Proteobacteria bacterium]|nr:DNA-processing protein DprA [Pseudomonadota bacterium]